jgi:acetyltransferase
MLDDLFYPRGVAVIGASNNILSIGNRVVTNLLSYGYKGNVYPVNPRGGEICGLKACPSILDVDDRVDLVNIVIKNTLVPKAIEDCGKKGVKFVIIHSSGFKEVGGRGVELEEEIVKIGRRYGMRIYGPNCQGIMNSDETVSLYANFTFTPMRPAGNISILAQSGGVGEILNLHLEELGIGFRMYASNGNACDVSINELLDYFGRDEKTRVVMLYIESLKDPEEFMKIAREITVRKSILGMKSGKTMEGARAISSHTGALASRDTTAEVIFKKCGIRKFESMEEMINTAVALSTQPLPRGRRVGVITNTGGPGIIAVDEIVEAGLTLPPIGGETKKRLKTCLNPEASIRNPVDLTATAGPEHFGESVKALMDDPATDAIMVNMITPFFVDCRSVADEIVKASRKSRKPVVSVIMTNRNWADTVAAVRKGGIPVYDYPETAAGILENCMRISELQSLLRKKADETVPSIEKDETKAGNLVKTAPRDRQGYITQQTAFELLRSYDIPVVETLYVNYDEMLSTNLSRAGEALGYPLVMKIDAEGVVHKTDAGAVILGIENISELESECRKAEARFRGKKPKIILQPYLTGGQEVIMGVKHAGDAGSIVMFGLGGIFVEVMKDVQFLLAPLTMSEAASMIHSIKGFPLLQGVRGKPGTDIENLTWTLVKLSILASDFPMIEEMDLNPVFAHEKGKLSVVADVRVKLGE